MTTTNGSMPANKPTSKSANSFGALIGFGILIVVIAFVGIWLQIQGKQVAAQTPSPVKPLTNIDGARFRADAWNLPSEPLLGFVEIPAGTFVMGSDPGVDSMAFENEKWSDEHHQGTVTLPAFYIGRYEVTVAQFHSFLESSGYKANKWLAGMPDHPATNLSWADALAYVHWLEEQLKLSPQTPELILQRLRDGWRITLPNEAQWEKAARSADGRIYPWGNLATRDFANFRGTSTTPVGTYACAKCAYGLADMSGNVWELTRSAYRPYPFASETVLDLQTDALFVMRGGAYSDTENTVRAAARGGIDPGARRPFIGFRIVLTRD